MKRPSVALAAVLVATAFAAAPAGAAGPGDAPWIGLQLRGTEVVAVVAPSPAQVAGLEAADRVLSVDGVAARTASDIAGAVGRHQLGDLAVVRVQRGAKRLSFAVFLAARPERAAAAVDVDPQGDPGGFADVEAPTLKQPPAPRPAARRPSGPVASDDEIAPVDLGRYRGDVVVVEFMASWCGACRGTIPALNAWAGRYESRGLHVVSVSSEDVGLLRRFRQSAGLETVLATDPGGALAGEHEVTALPTLVVFDREGRARGRFVGGGENLRRIETLFRSLLADDGGGQEDGVRF